MLLLAICTENAEQQNPTIPRHAAGNSEVHLAEVTTNEAPGTITGAAYETLADVQELSTGEQQKVYTSLHIYAN